MVLTEPDGNCCEVPDAVVTCGIPLYENEGPGSTWGGALTNFPWADSWIELLAVPLAPSEVGIVATEAGAMAPVGNYALKQPSTVYGSSNFNVKAACTTGESYSFTPCFIVLPITTFPSESTRRHYWPQWRTNCISITRMNSCRILSHHISSLHVSSCSVFVG